MAGQGQKAINQRGANPGENPGENPLQTPGKNEKNVDSRVRCYILLPKFPVKFPAVYNAFDIIY